MGKKALQLASVASMIDQFNIPNIRLLQSLGYDVDVAADFTNPGNITKERADELKERLHDMGVRVWDIPIPRSLNPAYVLRAYKDVKKIVSTEHYNLIHCHSPIGGVILRQAAKPERKKGTKVIYTAHGFHFCDGAPVMNWLIYYPIEKYYSRYTDVLITINKEDYRRAVKKLHAKKTVYVPGIGVDTDKYVARESARIRIRKEFDIKDSDIMLLSVGEFNKNKNHKAVIEAIKGIDNLTYVIVGKSEKEQELQLQASKCGVNLKLAGFRNDVADFYSAADVYVLPSFREGLNVSLMEAMASGLPVACGRIRGNTDLIKEKRVLFDPRDTEEIRASIINAMDNRDRFGQQNLERIKAFDLSVVLELISDIYRKEEINSGRN
ncbi:MAG: glycosyltransferase family 4 protein [Lachnospiraceae bacterium]|nr:glycosyltransferase family 4 protein [Lachnospiraceae bacterium]